MVSRTREAYFIDYISLTSALRLRYGPIGCHVSKHVWIFKRTCHSYDKRFDIIACEIFEFCQMSKYNDVINLLVTDFISYLSAGE